LIFVTFDLDLAGFFMKRGVFFIVFSLLSVQLSVLVAQVPEPNKVFTSQEVTYLQHRVQRGETLTSLSSKYQVDTKVLIQHNPSLLHGLRVGDILKIPTHEESIPEAEQRDLQHQPDTFIIHEIQRRETPFFVAKKYAIDIEDIYRYNPELKRFRRGREIRIPQFFQQETGGGHHPVAEEEPTTGQSGIRERMIEHRVKPGETLYSIAQQYDRSIGEILSNNPEAQPLKTGMIIRLPEEKEIIPAEERIRRAGDFFMHRIETGETLYGLTRRYHISESELTVLNPVLETGFPAGVELKIPLQYLPDMNVQPINEEAFTKHMVKKGETLYRLSSLYDLTIGEIKKANPELQTRESLVEGEILLIPQKTDLQSEHPEENTDEEIRTEPKNRLESDSFYEVETLVEVPESCRPTDHFPLRTYHVALMLPLFLEANDTLNNKPVPTDSPMVEDPEALVAEADTLEKEFSPQDQTWQFYGNTEDYLHFYEGVLLAVDALRSSGMHVELHVYDTQRNPRIIDSLLITEKLFADLIIGPVYPSLQKPVADFAAKNRIPFVSPLSPEGYLAETHPYYFQVYPSKAYMLEQTAGFIADEYYDCNFIVMDIGTPSAEDSLFIEMCREKLYNTGYYRDISDVSFRIYDFNRFGGQGLSRILSKTRENVFVIPSFNEGEVSVAVSNINNYASDFPVTVIGHYRYKQFESISQEHFHHVKLKYFYPYWTDYTSPATIRFISRFRENFYTDPDPYAMQGYDVTLYFLSALGYYGRTFTDCLPYLEVGLTQGDYRFEKVSRFGGFMNRGITLISFRPDFTLEKKNLTGKIRYLYTQRDQTRLKREPRD
jgi:LysM repeat protein/ABC-type branched-subunit amino acid transport system substrate-binding protein